MLSSHPEERRQWYRLGERSREWQEGEGGKRKSDSTRGECFRGELTALGLVCNTLTTAQPLPLVAILSGRTSRLVTQDKQRGRREPARVLPTVEWGHDGLERSASPSRFTDLQQLWFRSSNPTSMNDAEKEI